MGSGSSDDLPKLLSQSTARRLLEDHGWVEEQGGKHQVKMVKPGERPITLPAAKRQDYSRGLTRAILKQAGLLPQTAESDG
jgi:predicted RNA binding protein YcfA (HicA-like mRNA interferase family)